MAEVDQLKDNITLNLNNLEELINKSPLFNSDPKKWKLKINGATKEITNDMLLFQEQVNNLPNSQSSKYVGSIKSLKTRIKKLQVDVEKREKGGDDNFINSLQRTPIIQSNEDKRMNAIQQVMKRGDDAQEQTKNSLKEMNIMVEKGIQMAADINLQLTKQIEQLDRMNDKVKDTSSTLQKAKKNIMYFVKALECDMCMAGLLVLILLALVGVIVLAVKKNEG